MRRPQGYAIMSEPDKPDVVRDTFTCGHCNSVVFVEPRQDPSDMGGFCCLCMSHICKACSSSTAACEPFEKKMEALEARDRFLRAACG